MDTVWDISNWAPTKCSRLSLIVGAEDDPDDPDIIQSLKEDLRTPKPAVLENLIRELPSLTKRIHSLPYDPTAWKARGNHLCKLYPELAVSDAYKGILLCNAAIEGGDKLPPRRDVLKHFGNSAWQKKVAKQADHLIKADFENEAFKKWNALMSSDSNVDAYEARLLNALRGHRKDLYLILLRALTQLDANKDGLWACALALRSYPGNKDLVAAKEKIETAYMSIDLRFAFQNLGSKLERYMTAELGTVTMKNYPWIPPEMLERNEQVIAELNELLSKHSNFLEIRPSKIGGFGMFAKKDIRAGDTILLSNNPISVSSLQMKKKSQSAPPINAACYNCCQPLIQTDFALDCCKEIHYCSEACCEVAVKNYHGLLHGKNYRAWYDAVNAGEGSDYSPEFECIVFLRILLVCVTAGGHPLKNINFRGLRTPYGKYTDANPITWSMRGHVVGPIQILRDLGVDVFANPDYDAWVLEHLWHRKVTNGQRNEDTDEFAMCKLDPLYSFFNHSCEFPTMFSVARGVDDRFFASRDIKEGEEVFSCYLPATALRVLSKKQRQAALESWIPGGKCKCKRCTS